MRVLVTSTPGVGHVSPILPLAVELRAQGHDVRWVTGEPGAETVAAAGFEVTVAGMAPRDRNAELNRRHPDLFSRPLGEARALAFSTHIGELAAPVMAAVLPGVVAGWRPDVLVHDAAELAAPLAAAAAGLPSVCLGFGELVPERSALAAGDAVAPLWEAAGLEPDPWAGSYRGLYVDLYPASLRGEPMDHVAEVQPRRPSAASAAAAGSLVYVTFGTVFNQIDDGFRAAVLGAAAMADEVLVTVGPTGDPAGIGSAPANVRVERFVPQAEVLPRCAAVVCHGGSGTLLASLAHGLPLLCLPRGADQFTNADNVARVGAGAVLRPPEVSEAAVRDALATLVGASPARTAASALATEIAAMPSDAEVAAAIAAFAAR
jgi:UDP:flavonoid glycosyltransferase YjiC (YdhE family)